MKSHRTDKSHLPIMIKDIIKKSIVYILELEAKYVIKKYNPKIIAITGSVGKTSTKDAIYTI